MRRIDLTNGKYIEYPEEICFAFNPEYIICNFPFTFTVSGNGKVFTDSVEAFAGISKRDISYYLKLLFFTDNNSLLNSYVNAIVQINADGINQTFNSHCIWGAISPGDTFNPAKREATYFSSFPQMFSVFTKESLPISKRIDKGAFVLEGSTNIGITNILITGNAHDKITYSFGGTGLNIINTFDYTFDNTFRLQPGTPPENEIKFIINNCSEGIFLRWIDRQGFYQYYLISRASMSFASKNEGEPLDLEYSAFGRWFYNVIRQNKSEEQVVNGFVSLVNKNDYYNLMSLFTSPLIWAYMGNDEWLPVTVQPVNNSILPKSLQNLNISIIFPNSQIQQL